MGACISKEDVAAKKQKKKQKGDLQVPEFFYLNRLNKKVLQLHPDAKITKIQIPNSFDLHTESAIGYLSKTRFMLAGGTDSTSCLTTDAFIADIDWMRLYKICGLPIPAKEGTLIEYDGFIYYVGGLIEAEDEASFLNEEPAPLTRYSIEGNFWEYLEAADKNNQKEESILFFPRKVIEKEDEKKPNYDKDFPLSNIMLPGVFLYDRKIYYVGGYGIKANGKIRMNKNVYSLDLKKLEFTKESFKLAIKSAKPACGVDGDEVIFAGGYDPKTGKSNSKCYIFSMADTEAGLKDLEPLSFELAESYPTILSTSSPIFISFPKFAFWNIQKQNWEVYDIGIKTKDPKASRESSVKSMKFGSLDTEVPEGKSQKSSNSYQISEDAQEENFGLREEISSEDEDSKAKSPKIKVKGNEEDHKIKSPKFIVEPIKEKYSSSGDEYEPIKPSSQAPARLPPGKAEIIARPIKADLKLGNKNLPRYGSYSERRYKENIINLNQRRPKINLNEISDSDSSEKSQKILKKISSSVLFREKQENSSSSLTDEKSELIIDPKGEISPIRVKKIISQNGKANTEFQLNLKSAWK